MLQSRPWQSLLADECRMLLGSCLAGGILKEWWKQWDETTFTACSPGRVFSCGVVVQAGFGGCSFV